MTEKHSQVDLAPGERREAVATCPAGSIATGGGFHAYSDGHLWVHNSSKSHSGEAWQAWADNLSASDGTLHAYVACLSGTEDTSSRTVSQAAAAPGAIAHAFPRCGSGSLVTSGGLATDDDLRIYSSSGPHPGNEWRAYVKNTHSSQERGLFGYDVCLSLPVHVIYLPFVAQGAAP